MQKLVFILTVMLAISLAGDAAFAQKIDAVSHSIPLPADPLRVVLDPGHGGRKKLKGIWKEVALKL